MAKTKSSFIRWFTTLGIKDVPLVGGKNASLGEMYRKLVPKGVRIPNGFAITAPAYFHLHKVAGIKKEIRRILSDLDTKDLRNLQARGKAVRTAILNAAIPDDLVGLITTAYRKLEGEYGVNVDVAVRSSATAEDLPDASFAGQQDTYLNIRGVPALLDACKRCFASLFTDRAISYRTDKHFDHFKVGLSIGVQKMVRSDRACSGVMFSIDTETGFRDAVLINASWGLGENIVQGAVTPDEYYIHKSTLKQGFKPIIGRALGDKKVKMVYGRPGQRPTLNVPTSRAERTRFALTDAEVLALARWACVVEDHYKKPMDLEWAKDGVSGKLFIVQARPETVQSRRDTSVLEEYVLHGHGKVLASGAPVGSKVGVGTARVIRGVAGIHQFKAGEVLVTEMTDPDWEPIMKIAAGIVTNRGGRTCFTGDTRLLTNRGYLSIREVVERYRADALEVLSVNPENLHVEWKRVTDGMVRQATPMTVEVSQTGRMKGNTLGITPDHKVLTFHDRQLVAREIREVLARGEYLTSLQRAPQLVGETSSLRRLYHSFDHNLGYLLGGIVTDGHVYLTRTHGEVQFIQKPTPEKSAFIRRMGECLQSTFGYSFHMSSKQLSSGMIRGKPARGTASAYRCFSKSIAEQFRQLEHELVPALLEADEEFVWNFLAGAVDGDGTYNATSNRVHLYCAADLLPAVQVACLRLGISFSVTPNRTIANVQMVDQLETLFRYTERVKGPYQRTKFGTRLFSARQLLSDIIQRVNYLGRIVPYVANNLLIDVEKIRRHLIPMIAGEQPNHELTNIVNSDLKMLRVSAGEQLAPQPVYNITVADHHNYFVYTNRYTPILVKNCHAAIVSRELGIPCIVGANDATAKIKTGVAVTVSCAEGNVGHVYAGAFKFEVRKHNLKNLKRPKTKVMINVGSPDIAFASSFIPNDGVGLAREEFIINDQIKIHPNALLDYAKLTSPKVKRQINALTVGYPNKVQYYVDKLAEGIGKIAAAFYPKDVIVRFSDFKTNEYANLVGGAAYEPTESNPMIGWRGSSRYYDPKFKAAFALECRAIHKVREVMGLTNLKVMVPFCRTITEAKAVLAVMAANGLESGINGLEVYVMCEIPSNVILAEEFAKLFDGFSIGSNDLTQLTLGVDRDSELVSHVYDERNLAVKTLISQVIRAAKKHHRKIGICGQAPSDFPDFAQFLVQQGIDSISLNPDTVVKTTMAILRTEQRLRKK